MFGVYVHIPFCSSRCDYCAFATWTDRHHLIEDYLAAVAKEVGERAEAGMPPATSVFFGGGTPTLVPARALVAVLAAIPRTPDAEVTVEANPDTVDAESLATYRHGGVTRMSFGVQSMDPVVLASLGRSHDPDNVCRAVSAAREAGFEELNVDLIMGAAGESVASWERTLVETLALDPTHVSAYSLTVEAGTPLASDPDRHPDDDDQATKYLLADDVLGEAGYPWYEVSNWARPGHECRHNQLYWTAGDYRGFGCAAHSHVAGRRWWNLRTPDRYIAAMQDGADVEAAGETLEPDERELERLQLALRTREGVPADALDLDDPSLNGLVDVVGDRLVLTPTGRLLANEVAIRLRPSREGRPVQVTSGSGGDEGNSST